MKTQGLIIALTLFLANPWAYGAEMWVTTTKLKSQESLEKLAEEQRSKIKDMDLDSLFDVELRSPVPQNELTSFFEQEDRARTSAIGGDFLHALDLYMKLLKNLKTVPNVSGVEKITFSTLIHIAELKSLLHSKDVDLSWIQAHAWSPMSHPSAAEFSPATLRRFSALSAPRSAVVAVKTAEEAMIFVDGHRVRNQDMHGETYKVHVEPGWHQVEVLVGGASWMIKNVTVGQGQWAATTVVPQPVVGGSCDSPIYRGESLPEKVRLLADFGGGCQRVYYAKTWYDPAGKVIVESQNPLSEKTAIPEPPKVPTITSTLPEMSSESRDESSLAGITKSPWLWAGLGVLVTGFLVVENQNPQTVLVPTHNVQ